MFTFSSTKSQVEKYLPLLNVGLYSSAEQTAVLEAIKGALESMNNLLSQEAIKHLIKRDIFQATKELTLIDSSTKKDLLEKMQRRNRIKDLFKYQVISLSEALYTLYGLNPNTKIDAQVVINRINCIPYEIQNLRAYNITWKLISPFDRALSSEEYSLIEQRYCTLFSEEGENALNEIQFYIECVFSQHIAPVNYDISELSPTIHKLLKQYLMDEKQSIEQLQEAVGSARFSVRSPFGMGI